jgi:hypothetical protein
MKNRYIFNPKKRFKKGGTMSADEMKYHIGNDTPIINKRLSPNNIDFDSTDDFIIEKPHKTHWTIDKLVELRASNNQYKLYLGIEYHYGIHWFWWLDWEGQGRPMKKMKRIFLYRIEEINKPLVLTVGQAIALIENGEWRKHK